jgi:hypothetical protein
MVKFRSVRRQGIARVEPGGCGRVEFGMLQVGAAMTVPQTEQVRWWMLAKNRSNIAGSSVSMLRTGRRSM